MSEYQCRQLYHLSSSLCVSMSRERHLVRYPEFHPFRELAQRDLQCLGNLPQSSHSRIDDPSLDPADVCSVEATFVAEALLRVACPFTKFAHHGADSSHLQIGWLDLLLAPLHQQIRWCYVETYQPTAYTPHLWSWLCGRSPPQTGAE
jgi:hypothetical protein